MGCHLSKGAESPVPRVFVDDGDENEGQKKKKKADYRAELTSYEAACRGDPELQSFDTKLHRKMTRALSNFSDGVEVCSLSLDSLKEVTGCLLEMNQEVAKLILDCKKDIWNTPDLFRLVEDYFDNSLQTLHFCTALNRCLKRARDPILLIQLSLHQFHEDSNYARALERLRELKQAAGNPFTQDFFAEFQAVYRQQLSVLKNLQLRKRKLDKKLKSVDAWRKVSCMIFAATFASVLICSVVAAAVAAPPVAAALAAASSIPLGSMGKWFDSLIKRFEDALKGQKEVISSMQAGTFVAINDLDHIRVMVDSLEIQICSLLRFAEFALKDEEEECVKVGVQGIQRKMQDFIKGIDDLGQQADRCNNDTRKARTILLQRIIRHPKDLTIL